MPMGGASSEIFASEICMQNAPLSRWRKSPVLASVQGNLGISAVDQQIRRLFGPFGGAAPQDVSAAADVDAISDEDDDFAAWVVYR